MTSAWDGFCVGFPPEVAVVERVLLSQIPVEDRDAFVIHMGGVRETTRSGEPVFNKKSYIQWKQSQ